MSDYILNLDPSKRSTDTIDFQTALRGKIVGQEEGVQALVDLYQVFRAGLNSPGRPVGNLLFLGPTGSGKTRIVEAASEILFGDPRSVIKVDCAEFQHSHEIAKLIGSPPGYLGHRETHPLITQETLAASYRDELMHGGMGFVQPTDKPATGLDEKVQRTAVEAARRKFSPEFMNRLDKVVVFHPLQREQLQEVLDIELGQVQQRVLDTAKGQFLFRVTEAGREFLLQEGTDQRYGARHLKRAIERHVVYPLANLLATDQVNLGDLVCIDWDESHKQLTFVREGEGALVQAAAQVAGGKAAAVEAKDGKSVEAPTETMVEERKSRAAQPGGGPAAPAQGRKKQER